MDNYRYNTFVILRNLIFSVRHADWQNANNKGFVGVVIELCRALIGLNTWPFFIDSTQDWNRKKIKAILDSRGIVMGGWGYSHGNYMFRVKKVHAQWAEYLMLQQGVPIRGKLLTSGRLPSKENSPDLSEHQQKLGNTAKRTEPADFFSDPIKRVNRLLDGLSNLL